MRFILLLLPALLAAQDSRFSFGVTGGFSFPSQATVRPVNYNQESRNYAIGPTFEYRFTQHVSLVVNPLYRRLGSSYALRNFLFSSSPIENYDLDSRTRTHNLSVPILGKYTFRTPQQPWRPFLTAGFELNQSWNTNEASQLIRNSSTGTQRINTFSTSSRSAFNSGIVIGAGLDRKWNRIHFTPEFRYTFQNPTNTAVEGRHKADFLLSIRF